MEVVLAEEGEWEAAAYPSTCAGAVLEISAEPLGSTEPRLQTIVQDDLYVKW